LGQVFTNLLSNAIKYSPDAETVEIDLITSAEAVTVRIRDHGLGIPREQLDRIFDRFYRVPDLSQRAIPGLGMGLYTHSALNTCKTQNASGQKSRLPESIRAR
jgi:signal transduction histidine kinase